VEIDPIHLILRTMILLETDLVLAQNFFKLVNEEATAYVHRTWNIDGKEKGLSMRVRCNYLSFILFLIIFSFMSVTTDAANVKSSGEFKFYDIGENDTKATTSTKLSAKGFTFLNGKATHFGIRKMKDKFSFHKNSGKMDEIAAMDDDFERFGEDLKIKDMPIDLIGCSVVDNDLFGHSRFYFSAFDNRILAIVIEIQNFNLVKEKLAIKYGSCIAEGYCEIGDSILTTVNTKIKYLQVYFYKNLKSHHNMIKKMKVQKEERSVKRFDEAFK
jgi:hypothetical protein